jgi:hypothetical protein
MECERGGDFADHFLISDSEDYAKAQEKFGMSKDLPAVPDNPTNSFLGDIYTSQKSVRPASIRREHG